MADLCYDSKRNVSLHCCHMFLWVVNVYKEIMLVHVQITAGIQLRYMMTIIFPAVDNRNAVKFKLAG